MAYTYKIDEEDPQALLPSFMERMVRGMQMDAPLVQQAGQAVRSGAGAMQDAFSATPAGQALQAGQNLVAAASNMRDSRQPYPVFESGGGSMQEPPVRSPASVMPANVPNVPRNYMAEVEAKDRMFNAERDTPAQTPAQAAYTSGMQSKQENAEINRPRMADQRDPVLQTQQWLQQDAAAGKYPDSAQNLAGFEGKMVQQIKAMLPGASPKEVRSIMTTITQATRNPAAMGPTQPSQPGGQINTIQDAVTKSQAGSPSIQKLGAGQSMYQVMPDGTAKLMTTAPGGSAENRATTNFKDQQKESVAIWAPIKKEYDKRWDKLTEDIPDGAGREKALRNLNAQHFRSLGVPDDLAEVPVSFTGYVNDWKATQPAGTKVSRAQSDQLAQEHRQLNKLRNRLLEMKFGNTLQFNGPTER